MSPSSSPFSICVCVVLIGTTNSSSNIWIFFLLDGVQRKEGMCVWLVLRAYGILIVFVHSRLSFVSSESLLESFLFFRRVYSIRLCYCYCCCCMLLMEGNVSFVLFCFPRHSALFYSDLLHDDSFLCVLCSDFVCFRFVIRYSLMFGFFWLPQIVWNFHN